MVGRMNPDALVGQTILERYRVVRPIAKGPSREVFLAHDTTEDRAAVVKFLCSDFVIDEEMEERFRREASVLQRLQHPNIVRIFAYGELDYGVLFIVMEHVEGTSLDRLMASGTPSPLHAVEIALQCARGLAHAHRGGVTHRDLKPNNVMVTQLPDGPVAKVLDFGVAQIAGAEDLTPVGGIVGTPYYMSPEQCAGERTTPACDQYSLGLILHEMLTGRPVMYAYSPVEYLQMHQDVLPPSPSSVVSDKTTRDLDPPVMRMLAKSPNDRFPDMDAVCTELERALTRATGKG